MNSVLKDDKDAGNEIVVTLNGVAAEKPDGNNNAKLLLPDKRHIKDLSISIRVLNNRLTEPEKGSKRYERALQRRIELERQLSRETLLFDSFFEKSSFFKRIREELTSIADIVSIIDFGGLKDFFKGLRDSCLDLSSYTYMISRFASSGFSLSDLVGLENKVENLSDALGGDLYGAIEKTDELIGDLFSTRRDEFGRYSHGPDAGGPRGRGSFIIKTRAAKTGRDIGKNESVEANTRAVEGLTRAIEGEVKGESVSKNTAIGGGKGSFIIKTRAERDEHGRYSKGPMPEIFSVIDDYIGELESSLEDVENCFGELDLSSMDNSFDIELFEKLKKDAKDVKDSLRTPEEVRGDDMAKELERLEELHDAKLLSEEEYEKAVQAVHDKYKQELLDEDLERLKGYFEKANKVMEGVSEFTSALQSAETAKLESEYQARLAAAGDNAERREAIEAEYEQKKLDLQKKYADADMAINIAKAIAAGALASVEAIAAAGGNPVLSAVFIALIAATTAAEVASIIQQRNAIKNASAGGGGGSAPKTGSREMTGYAEGGYTEDHTTVTTVGERGREWVAPAWMVRKNPVTFSNLERYRKTGSHGRSGSVSRGFADGGFTENVSEKMQGGMLSVGDLEAAVETAIVKSMQNGAIRAYLVRNDLTELDAQTERLKKMTSR